MAVALVLMTAGACSEAPSRPAAPPATAAPTPLDKAIAAIARSLTLLQDDLGINGNLTVPQNRYRLDIEKLATAIRLAGDVLPGLPMDAATRSDVGGMLTDASSLVVSLDRSVPRAGQDGLTELDRVTAALAVVRHDLGTP